jgi:nitrite reductase (NADH) large subunit
LEWTGAYLQYYREQASWNERTAHWVERVGLESIKQALANAETRRQLVGRIEETLSATSDPWHEIIHNEELRKNFVRLPKLKPSDGIGG